jgi:hypothetical protein
MGSREGRLNGDELVRGFERSGKTRVEYCAEVGERVSRLDYHVRRGRERAREAAQLVRVEIAEPNSRAGLRLVLGEGLEIEVERNFDEATLRRLLAVLAD